LGDAPALVVRRCNACVIHRFQSGCCFGDARASVLRPSWVVAKASPKKVLRQKKGEKRVREFHVDRTCDAPVAKYAVVPNHWPRSSHHMFVCACAPYLARKPSSLFFALLKTGRFAFLSPKHAQH
jgi:hypothetical protein